MSPKLAIAQINTLVGDIEGNRQQIFSFAQRAAAEKADILLTPELSLTGYPPEDLLLRPKFLKTSQEALETLATALAVFPDLHVLVGHPLIENEQCFNACSVLLNGRILCTYRKQALPNDSVFDEKRWFTPGTQACCFTLKGVTFGIAICHDIWSDAVPAQAKAAGAEVLLAINASPYQLYKQVLRYSTVKNCVLSQRLALVYANLVGGQDELVFDGNSFVMSPEGAVCLHMAHCAEELGFIQFEGKTPLMGSLIEAQEPEARIYQVLVLAVRDYLRKNGFKTAVLGLSGGVDSALVLAIAVDALGAENVQAIMMPSSYTADISIADARSMVARVNVKYDEMDIRQSFCGFLGVLSSAFYGKKPNEAEENIQSRIRGLLLMALSNKLGSMVLTTGNKSETAVGYSTLYGDTAGGFAVLKDIPKMLVYRLCHYRNQISHIIPERVLTRAPSAELRRDQTDQDNLPPYDVLDDIIHRYVEEKQEQEDIIAAGHDAETVKRILRMIHLNEYKRRQSPPGPRMTTCAFGRDWRFPITSAYRG